MSRVTRLVHYMAMENVPCSPLPEKALLLSKYSTAIYLLSETSNWTLQVAEKGRLSLDRMSFDSSRLTVQWVASHMENSL